MRRRRKALVVLALTAVVVGTILLARPWSGDEVPAASEYSSASDLARDLNEHGLGCADPAPTRGLKVVERYLRVVLLQWPETLVCSVSGRAVVLSVTHPEALNVWLGPESTSRYTNVQAAAADANDGLEIMLVGPNWMVMPRQPYGSIPALSAIRDELGGTLVVASATPTPSPSI